MIVRNEHHFVTLSSLLDINNVWIVILGILIRVLENLDLDIQFSILLALLSLEFDFVLGLANFDRFRSSIITTAIQKLFENSFEMIRVHRCIITCGIHVDRFKWLYAFERSDVAFFIFTPVGILRFAC